MPKTNSTKLGTFMQISLDGYYCDSHGDMLAGATSVFHVALVAGAPWGALTQGRRFTGASVD